MANAQGLQLGKLVISSDAVGSGSDRIRTGFNGYIFPAGNVEMLGDIMQVVIDDSALRDAISATAASKSKTVLPEDNANALIRLLR